MGNNAQQVRVRVIDPTGKTVLGLRATAAGATVDHLDNPTTAGAFDINVWFAEPTKAFGLVHVIVETSDPATERHLLQSFTVFLAGLQLALVDDFTGNVDGSTVGSLNNEAQEKVILDFTHSPVRDVPSSNLFLLAAMVLKTEAQVAVANKTENTEKARKAFEGIKKAHDRAATALSTAVSQTTAAHAKAKLKDTKAKLTAVGKAMTDGKLSDHITDALDDGPDRDTTNDAAFDAAMTQLAAAFTAVDATINPALTQASTALSAALTGAEAQVDVALTQVETELSQTATPAAKTAANTARVAATTAATTQLQTFETQRAAGQTAAKSAHDLVAPSGSAAHAALTHAKTALDALLATAKQKANEELKKKRRARRMVRYAIKGDQERAFKDTGVKVPQPQMPMFMAELQVFGVQKAPIEEFLLRRKNNVPALGYLTDPQSVQLEIDWKLAFMWKGPDCDPPESPNDDFHDPHPGGYKLGAVVTGNPECSFKGVWTANKLSTSRQKVTLKLGADNTLSVTDNAVSGAFDPVPVKLPFPTDTRRVPEVAIKGPKTQRPWGRSKTAKTGPAMVVEWQIPVVDSDGREIVRGGDGELTVETLKIDGKALQRGVSATAAAATSDLRLVRFRVSGENVTPADTRNADVHLSKSIEQAVAETYGKLADGATAKVIDVKGWKLAYRRIVHHESSSMQFNEPHQA
ncbi:MAG TPA: hypothetical protein VGL81_35475 [Polyangiaceae bacterium]